MLSYIYQRQDKLLDTECLIESLYQYNIHREVINSQISEFLDASIFNLSAKDESEAVFGSVFVSRSEM